MHAHPFFESNLLMPTLFISDLHLDDARPAMTALFADFTRTRAREAKALYILGDLFEAWVGDDDPSECARVVAESLRALSDSGTAVYFMHGNRDFLLGTTYAQRCGMQLLQDPSMIRLYDKNVLLMHGDTLCTDDQAYQAFRAQTRDLQWQTQFLSQPLAARVAFAQQARSASKQHQGELRVQGDFEVITDVSSKTVQEVMTSTHADILIHGHTHRPDIHDENGYVRIVLGDWYEQGSVLVFTENGYILERLN